MCTPASRLAVCWVQSFPDWRAGHDDWPVNVVELTALSYDEADATGTQPNFDYFTVDEYLKTTGAGINLKIGAIFKPAEFLRLGLNVQTPSWYSMRVHLT